MLKLSWLQKFASVNFYISNSNKISQPKTVEYLANDLLIWADKHVPKQLRLDFWDFITSDGEGHSTSTGVINWYFPTNIQPHRLTPFIEQGIEEVLVPMGVEIGRAFTSKSNLHKANTWRIPVISNPTSKQEELPKLNIKNDFAEVLFNLLNVSPEGPHGWIGQIPAQELLSKIQLARTKVHAFTASPREDVAVKILGTEIGRGYDPGINEEQLNRYLNELEKMCQRALQGDFPNPTISWS